MPEECSVGQSEKSFIKDSLIERKPSSFLEVQLNKDDITAGRDVWMSFADKNSTYIIDKENFESSRGSARKWHKHIHRSTSVCERAAVDLLTELEVKGNSYFFHVPIRVSDVDMRDKFSWLGKFLTGSEYSRNSIKLGEALYELEKTLDISPLYVDQLMETLKVDKYSLELTLGILGTLFSRRDELPSWEKLKLNVKDHIEKLGKNSARLLAGFE